MKRNANVKNFDQLPESAYIRQSALIQMLPFSAATLWRKTKRGEFPAPVKLSDRVTAWRVGDVRDWIASLSDKNLRQSATRTRNGTVVCEEQYPGTDHNSAGEL